METSKKNRSRQTTTIYTFRAYKQDARIHHLPLATKMPTLLQAADVVRTPSLRSLYSTFPSRNDTATGDEELRDYDDAAMSLVVLSILLIHIVVVVFICSLLDRHCAGDDDARDGLTITTIDEIKAEEGVEEANDEEDREQTVLPKVIIRRMTSQRSSMAAATEE